MGTLRMEPKNTVAANRRFAGLGRIFATRNSQLATQGFTLTELLVVIAIIAILASLITAAAVNAMNAAKRTAITTEIRQLGDAIERFKTNLGGAYPPNVYFEGDLSSSPPSEVKINLDNLRRFLTKARPMAVEFVSGADPTQGMNNIDVIPGAGLRPSEALVLWLSGFSGDPKRPFTGADLEVTTIHDEETNSNIPDVITFESFDAPLYEFDTTRLRFSRDGSGNRRFLTVYRPVPGNNPIPLQLQLYEYFPKGSEQPYVYFNTVDTPETVVRTWRTDEFYYENPEDNKDNVCALKRFKPNTPTSGTPTVSNLEYVNQGKYQILHAGLDDAWGDFIDSEDANKPQAILEVENANFIPDLLFPTGPFTADLADTLSNFADGDLENEQE